jgi:hypothetical protein
MDKIFNRAVKLGGTYRTIDGEQVHILLTGTDDRILYAKGTTVPDDKTNYEKGCFFVKTNGDADSSVYINTGDVNSCTFSLIENDDSTSYDVLEESKVYTEKVTINTAAIKTLRATPVEIIAAPGAGKMIEFLGATLKYDYSTAGLTESADNFAFKYTDGSGLAVSETIETTG